MFKLDPRRSPDSGDRQNPRFPKFAERFLNVRPRRVLRQIRPNDHLKARSRRPPVLASPLGKQRLVISADRVVSSFAHGMRRLGCGHTIVGGVPHSSARFCECVGALRSPSPHQRTWSAVCDLRHTRIFAAEMPSNPALPPLPAQYRYLSYFFGMPLGLTICVSAKPSSPNPPGNQRLRMDLAVRGITGELCLSGWVTCSSKKRSSP